MLNNVPNTCIIMLIIIPISMMLQYTSAQHLLSGPYK